MNTDIEISYGVHLIHDRPENRLEDTGLSFKTYDEARSARDEVRRQRQPWGAVVYKVEVRREPQENSF